ncbi:MAG: YkgJ family cysteine cluster protein [Deltaproteobacteria bacterium]|nr:YkgJ family cysteine cluster protein [Deltaproteobacteria bacterium]MBW2017298.1 YkgJ family cysteine cluster protein [Deltaproteobacteria bacterium]MBW2129398.1 YkgJ family cysteine cluster protein [Deltaproteobacteria bacterium]MBW2303570.1 YkgJ family cysteine cluster protein [Deltaproteobacteria bacterium]
MDRGHLFHFRCYPGISCFTQCCRDVTILLTPYDVVRLKNGLGISSDTFLDSYTLVLPKKNRLIPMVVLKMNEDDKRCPFVSEKGCSVYPDRPWPCRMYPLDMADDGTFHLITDPARCGGLKEKDTWKIDEWLKDQGTDPYDEMNELLSTITIPLQARDLDIDNPDISRMVFMSLYNLDKFREFVFKSSFLDRLDVEPERVERIKENDIELLKFSFDWIKFGLFGEKLFWVKETPRP